MPHHTSFFTTKKTSNNNLILANQKGQSVRISLHQHFCYTCHAFNLKILNKYTFTAVFLNSVQAQRHIVQCHIAH